MTAEEIKQMYSMQDILKMYGIQVKRGFCCCPFHNEKTGSMKIYKDSYNCFGCGANGDIFTFIQQIDGVSFKEAYIRLGGTYKDHRASQIAKYHFQQQKKNREIKEQKRKQEEQKMYKEISNAREDMAKTIPLSDDWWDALAREQDGITKMNNREGGGQD